jgi:hypothetical protein
VGGDSKRPDSEPQLTTQLTPIEVEALARASAVGTVETEPIDDERPTVEMVALVAIADDDAPTAPVKLARGSDAVEPRTERLVHLRRRRESLAVTQIVVKKRTETGDE